MYGVPLSETALIWYPSTEPGIHDPMHIAQTRGGAAELKARLQQILSKRFTTYKEVTW
jgi:hypothetical protein